MEIETIKLKSEQDNLELEVGIIKPKGEVKGIVQISHGMTEHKERYYTFMEYLVDLGYVSVINDHRGHGKSIRNSEDYGYFYDTTSDYIVEDMHQVTLYIKNRYPNKKIILLGHSMGAMASRKYLKKYDKDIDKLILCGSPSKNSLVDFGILMVKILTVFKGDHYRSELIQNLALDSYNEKFNKKSQNEWISSNENTVKEYDADEKCGFTFTLNGFQNLFKLMKDIYSKSGWQVENKSLPILFLAGSDDPIIRNEKAWIKSQDFLGELGYMNISNKLYPNMRHEVLNERTKDVVFKDISDWIEVNR